VLRKLLVHYDDPGSPRTQITVIRLDNLVDWSCIIAVSILNFEMGIADLAHLDHF
jgi:hypothetical protein